MLLNKTVEHAQLFSYIQLVNAFSFPGKSRNIKRTQRSRTVNACFIFVNHTRNVFFISNEMCCFCFFF